MKITSAHAESILDDLGFEYDADHYIKGFEIVEERVVTLNMEDLAEVINRAVLVRQWV